MKLKFLFTYIISEYNVFSSPVVEGAMRSVDRMNYSAIKEEAYQDHPHPIGYGATISAPRIDQTRISYFCRYACNVFGTVRTTSNEAKCKSS